MDVESIAKKHGFCLVKKENLKEIDGIAWVLKHEATGARLLFLQNDDEDKSFSISFKTPPKDSTGVFHILEHSVLCGSKKYPVKEPFVNLLKSSMQTFLNAMTFPDKTVYPVASTNEKDLLNLMNIYLDAVFNPRIYSSEEIFLQEGWHKEADENGNLKYSGVVYNEMQGALSDANSVLFDAICERLYPGSAYSFESGGDPKNIPDLTYENFLKTHACHYSPSNSYIQLYGNLNPDEFLRVISEDYLLPVQAEIDAGERQAPEPFFINDHEPVNSELAEIKMDVSEDAAPQAIAFKVCPAKDVVTFHAIDILLDAIMSSNVSPLKARLLATGVAQDFSSSLIEPVETPALMFACQAVKSDDALEVMQQEILSFMQEWAENGVDADLLHASIDHAELAMREFNFGTSDGVIYAMNTLSTWLYDDDKPTDALKFESYFPELRKMLDNGGFEELIKKYFLSGAPVAKAKIMPAQKESEAAGVKLSDDEISQIEAEVEKLHELQQAPDAPDDVAKLPYLQRSDVNDSVKKRHFEACESDGFKLLHHREIQNSGLNYFDIYFDCSKIDVQDYQYLSLLTLLLGKFDTEDFTAEQIHLDSRRLFGKLYFKNVIPVTKDDAKVNLLKVCTSCLSRNSSEAANLVGSILATPSFGNAERLAQILMSLKIRTEEALINSGHVLARRRAESTLTWRQSVEEIMSGITMFQFLCDACDNFDESIPRIAGKCSEVLKKLTAGQVIVSDCADEDSLQKFMAGMDLTNKSNWATGDKLPVCAAGFEPTFANESFAVKSDVTFTAVRSNLNLLQNMPEFSGSWAIASRVLSYDYLWNTIRVQAGAYGCGFGAAQNGSAGFYTYRDPHVDSSIETIKKAANWLADFDANEREFDGYVVSSVADFDKPMKASALMNRSEAQFFSGRTEDDREKLREEALHTSLDDVRALSESVQKIIDNSSVCVIGNEETIASSAAFDTLTKL